MSLAYEDVALSSKDTSLDFDDATLVFSTLALLRLPVKDTTLGFDDTTLTPILTKTFLGQIGCYNEAMGYLGRL